MIAKVRKALTGGIAASVAALVTAAGEGGVTTPEWMVVIGSGVLAGIAVWTVPNTPAARRKAAGDT